MRAISTATATAIAATALASAAPAQDAALSEADVQGFVEAMTEESRRIVAEGAWDDLRGWVERHVAEEARLAASGAVVGVVGPTMRFDLVADRDDMLLLSGMMATGPRGVGTIEGYSLTSAVDNVSLLPNGEAVATVRFHESGQVALPEADGGADAPAALAFHSTASCDMRFAGTGEAIRITAVACDVRTTM